MTATLDRIMTPHSVEIPAHLEAPGGRQVPGVDLDAGHVRETLGQEALLEGV